MTTRKIAGGRATEAGMAFQAGVGAWFAGNIVAEMPVGARFGLANATPTTLRFETGDLMDDIEVELQSGGVIFVQCKTRISPSARSDSEFAKVVSQLVALRRNKGDIDPSNSTAVLAVSGSAPRTLDFLNDACRAFDLGSSWETVTSGLSESRLQRLRAFETQVRASWEEPDGPSYRDLEELARLFRVVRFEVAVSPFGTDLRSCAVVLGSRVYGGEDAGDQPMRDLVGICRNMIGSGALANRVGLLQSLRTLGHVDTRAPSHQNDIDRLRDHTATELNRLSRHRTLPIDKGIPLSRSACRDALSAAASENLIVVGEPGSGKTGVLLELVANRIAAAAPIVLISVDRHSGVASLRLLEEDLRLDKPLIENLSHWPGNERGILVIDSLDASRGGPSEGVFATLIEETIRLLSDRWTVLASIRTFDLINGTRYRTLVPGTPPNIGFSDSRLASTRHFLVRELNTDDFSEVSQRSSRMRELLNRSSDLLISLFTNVFNLSLAARLLEDGVIPQSIVNISTQSDLIDRYEDIRLSSAGASRAVRIALEAMVERHALSVREVEIEHDAVREVVAQGVFTLAGDMISFSHHILFDHAAGRYLLDWTDSKRLFVQITGKRWFGLILGPGLRFAIERIWNADDAERRQIWLLVERIVDGFEGGNDLDPIATSVVLKSIAAHIHDPSDVEGLVALLRTASQASTARMDALSRVMSQLARYVKLHLDEEQRPKTPRSWIAWATVAEAAADVARTGAISFLDGSRILLMALADRADLDDRPVASAFGRASRALLRAAWTFESRAEKIAVNAIRFVGLSFGTDPGAARELLATIFEESHFAAHAHEEAPYLAEYVRNIARYDSEFAIQIYEKLFGRDSPSEGATSMGDSRILPLSSNRRQDYEFSRHYLREAARGVLDDDATTGFRAVNVAVIGEKTRSERREILRVEVSDPSKSFTIINDDILPQAWEADDDPDSAVDDGGEILRTFVVFLRECSAGTFRKIIKAAVDEPTSATVWSRILGVARKRPELFVDELWPIASNRKFLQIAAIVRDAVAYLGTIYAGLPEQERERFERMAAAALLVEDEGAALWRMRLGRLVSVIPRESFVTEEFRRLHAELTAAGEANGNEPFLTITSLEGDGSDVGDLILARDGVDLANPSDRAVNELSKKLVSLLRDKSSQDASPVEWVARLWAAVKETIEELDRQGPAAHQETLHRAWGAVSEAVERIANSNALSLDDAGMPSGDEFVSLLDTLSRSHYPFARTGEDADEDRSLSWGNWDVRVYAALAVIPAIPRVEGELRKRLMEVLDLLSSDPVASVRLQVARPLHRLHGIDPETTWRLLEELVRRESNAELLAHVITGPLLRVASANPIRLEGILQIVFDRFPARRQPYGDRSALDEALGQLIAIIAVNAERPTARNWIDNWLSDLPANRTRLQNVIAVLRTDLFVGYRPSHTQQQHVAFERAKAVLDRSVATAAGILERVKPLLLELDPNDDERKELEAQFLAADRLLDQCCDQLFFGSGTFTDSRNGEQIGLVDAEAKRRFLMDYATTLEHLGRVGAADTLHHLLDLLAFTAEADPPVVWDRISAILVGGGAAAGYHLESLGAEQVVGIVRRYLADYRFVFENPARRQSLISVLDLFAQTGWPDALKLLYDLPDQLR